MIDLTSYSTPRRAALARLRWKYDLGVPLDDHERLLQRLREAGAPVVDAVPAFSGLYPTLGGYGHWELLFTRSRLLALSDAGVSIWGAYTGPNPTRCLLTLTTDQLAVHPSRYRYDRILLGRHKLWVDSKHRAMLLGWSDHQR
jgi:hypothetical protein